MATDVEQRRRLRLGRGARGAAVVLVALVLVGVMLRLSLWQWDRGEQRHSLLNYAYGVEWALFAVLTVTGLVRLAVEDARLARREADPDAAPEPAAVMPGPGGPVIGPPLSAGEDLEEITWIRLRRRVGLDRR